MKNGIKNKNVILGIFIMILVSIVVLFLSFKQKTYDDSALTINYLSKDYKLVVSNTLPMTDVIGKEISLKNYKENVTGYVEFEVKSNIDSKVKYEIYLTKENNDLEVPVKFVKVYLTDYDNKPLKYFDGTKVPTYYDLNLASKNPGGKLIYSGSLKGGESKKFKLRMWVADTYELTADEISFSANLMVDVK